MLLRLYHVVCNQFFQRHRLLCPLSTSTAGTIPQRLHYGRL